MCKLFNIFKKRSSYIYDVINTIDVYDEIATAYYSLRQKPWKIAFLSKGSIILDLGSGPCINGIYIGRTNKSYIICLDTSFRMGINALKFINKNRVIGDFIAADATKPPLRNSSIESIIAIASIHHIPKPLIYKALIESFRILSPKGILILTIWSWRQPRFAARTFLNAIMNLFGILHDMWRYIVIWRSRGKRYKRIYYLYPLSMLIHIITLAGFRILSYGYIGYLRLKSDNIYIIASKPHKAP